MGRGVHSLLNAPREQSVLMIGFGTHSTQHAKVVRHIGISIPAVSQN